MFFVKEFENEGFVISADDKAFVLELLHEEHVLLVHGSGFSPELGKGHVRLVYLADTDVLDVAFDRIERFLEKHRSARMS